MTKNSKYDEQSLQSAILLMQDLFSGISKNTTSLAVLEEQVELLTKTVDELNYIINGKGDDSLLIKIALLDNKINDLDEKLSYYEDQYISVIKEMHFDEDREDEYNRAKTLGFWKLAIVAIPGIISLALGLLELIKN